MKAREPRTNVVLPARIRWNGRWISATARNISPHGLMLCAVGLPPPGTYVEIHLLTNVITARSVWCEQQLCGFETAETLNVTQLAAPGGAAMSGAVIDSGFGKKNFKRSASPAVQAERSRAFGRSMQFLTMVALSVTAAGSLGWEVYHTLQAPFTAISNSMGGGA